VRKLLALRLIACLVLGLSGCKPGMDYYALLAEYSDFAHEETEDVTFTYGFDEPQLAQLNKKWGLSDIAGDGDTQTRALNLMHWLRMHTEKVTDGKYEGEINAAEMLAYAFDNEENGLVCKHYAITLSEMLLAVGIQAKALWCYPMIYVNDNHVVTRAYLPEESRWVMLDPSFDLYVMDEAGRILDAPEIRQGLAERAPLHLNERFTYRGTQQDYFDYMAKDMWYFDCMLEITYGRYPQGDWTCLVPTGIDVNPSDRLHIATYESFWA